MEDDDDLHGNPAVKAHIKRLRAERGSTRPIHELKTHPKPFEAVWKNEKQYELRENDRNFEVGDWLKLREFDPCAECEGTGRTSDGYGFDDCVCKKPHGTYSGRFIVCLVTYMTKGGDRGLPDELCVMSIVPQRYSSQREPR